MQDTIINYYDDLARNYDADRFGNSYGKFIDTCERKIVERLLTAKDETVLDLACGSGRLVNFATIGIDASAGMLAVAKEKFSTKEFYQADAQDLPLEASSVDTILIFHFFMHLEKKKIDQILSECHRVLKNHGRIIFDIPSQKRRRLLGYKSEGWHGNTSFSLKEIQCFPNFSLKHSFGLIFLPIHRFPKFTRPFLNKIDTLLANSFMKEYSSYLIVELVKNEAS